MTPEQIDRNKYWSGLSRVAKEYYAICGRPDPDGLQGYLKEYYGINMVFTTGQMITADYSVENEDKYLVFILKFMT